MQTLFRVSVYPCVQSHTLTSVRTLNIPVVHARVRWIMERLKHPACAVCWVARLCRGWLSPGKATRISYGKNPKWTLQLLKKNICAHGDTEATAPFSFKACNATSRSTPKTKRFIHRHQSPRLIKANLGRDEAKRCPRRRLKTVM